MLLIGYILNCRSPNFRGFGGAASSNVTFVAIWTRFAFLREQKSHRPFSYDTLLSLPHSKERS